MHSNSVLILSETFESRLAAVEKLTACATRGDGTASELREVASLLDGAAARFSDQKTGGAYAAFADLIRVAAQLVEWRRAILDAAPDGDRFKRSAIERLALWLQEYGGHPEAAALADVARDVREDIGLNDVGSVCLRLSKVSLPVGILGDSTGGLIVPRVNADDRPIREARLELNVAFLQFSVDQKPADQLQFLTPHETHDLELQVRVSRWPDQASELRLTPISIEAAGTYEFPTFTFTQPQGAPPFTFTQRGRAVIKIGHAFRAQPFEFRYAAEFWPKGTEQPVSVVGHRTLRIESIDVRTSPITGYGVMDLRLLAIRNILREISPMPQDELGAAMSIATPLASLAARAVQDALFHDKISETKFQECIRDELRKHPAIGSALEVHPHAAGGITDLSFQGIRLELKVVRDRGIRLEDCMQFVEQTASYAVGSGKRLGCLCVLDVSTKTEAAFSAEEGLGVLMSERGIPIITFVIQGCLPRPSDLSR